MLCIKLKTARRTTVLLAVFYFRAICLLLFFTVILNDTYLRLSLIASQCKEQNIEVAWNHNQIA